METQDVVNDNEVIETDAQQHENEDEQGDSPRKYPFDEPTKADVDIREDKMSIYQYMRDFERGRLITDPDYQRNLVWKPAQMSRFIESILLGFPLPPFYLNQTREGKYTIIDGLQRTTTMNKFFKDEFALVGLSSLEKLNGQKFSELPDGYRAKIEDKNILLYILKPSTPVEVVYELFDRINTGGTPLNRQEVRNCIFLGESTKLLKELSQEKVFREAIDNGLAPTRMKDREVVLRYLAFKIFDYEKDYTGDLSAFLENAMKAMNKMGEEELEILRQDFKRVMRLSYEFFGKNNFRYPILNKDGVHSRGFINTSMFESIAYFFSQNTDDFLKSNKERIKENYQNLLKNPTYIDAVRFSTGSKFRVINRFQLAQEILSNIA
ncbi:MAG: DUF262 domain-containing protein [Bacteroidetes bacterium]|nr:MAG: DUF262 domain-containing protein [Bacteroidota bacterium]